ncbi:hypothetical protein QBC39DRAFT_361588 [Podospora conica]|nr:hypothetical protein QBC39DRAFT_361588 [Schizothecium conicum]
MDSKASTAYPNPPRPLGSPFQLETAGIKVSKGSPKNTGCQFVEPAPIRASAPLGFRQLLNAGSRDANRPGTPFPLQTSLFPAHIEKSSHDMGTQVGFGPYSAPAREAGSRGVKRPASPLPPQTSNRDVGTQTSLSPPHHPAHINKTSNDMGTQTSEPKEMEEGSPRDMQTKAGLGSDPSGTLTLQPGSRGAKRLMDPQAWLDDTVIDMALSACAALGGQHDELITIPSSMSSLESNPENCPVYIQHLKSLPRDRLEALVPLNPGRHWVLAQANFGDRTVYLYDSMSSARQGTVPASTQALIHSFLDRLFGENPAHWRVTLCSCPQQVDDSSCGIFSIATAFHVAARKPLPANYSPFFWRSVILCLLCPSRKNTALWPFTAQDDDAAIKAWSTEQASPDTERDVHDELSSGCSVTRRMAILQQMMDSAKARLGKCQQRIEQDIAARESVLAELVVLDSISQGPGTAEEGAVPQGGLGLSAEDVDKQWRAIETTMSQFALCPELAHPEQISLLSNRRAELRPVKLRMKLAADAKRAREVLLQRLDGPLKEAADIGLASVDKLGQARREMEL